MYQLKRAHLVQFFLFQAQTLELDLSTAIIAPNGAGKSALLDALQIVMLGGDRNQIRFNAQAGGSHRARTIRDYCLGVYRSGDDGRDRETATTYLSLVFEDQDSGETLTAGIALAASAAEPDHRVNGLYLLPRVALSLDDHLEVVKGEQLPQEWSRFRELIAQRCKAAGSKAELHSSSDRFVKDLLFRLRPGPTAQLDAVAYRKAFQNALNLQRVSDVDLFVRTLVAEERPTEIGKFRALLDGFRLIKEKIEQVARRIDEAEQVEQQYRKVAQQATRAASYRALGAEYQRDLHSERVDAAEQTLATSHELLRGKRVALAQARSDRENARLAADEAGKRLQGTRGYHEQASFEQLAAPYQEELARLKKELMRSAGFVRDQLQAAGKLGLPGVDAHLLKAAIAPWQSLYDQLAALVADADILVSPEALHDELRQAIEHAAPIIAAVTAYERERHNALDQARQGALTARQNLARLNAGQSELRPDVARMMSYLADAGVEARPVCDLVQVTDPAWQRAIEGYLRTHVEALLIAPEHEEQAVRLYRSLQGARSVYGVKLALCSHARQSRGDATPAAGQVASLLTGDNDDALAYLRRQLGDLRCVATEAEVVRSRHGLSNDGLVAKGGGVERLRLPAASELKIGASSSRERQKLLREELDAAERRIGELESQWRPVQASASGLARIGNAEDMARDAHELLLKHRQAAARYRALKDNQEAASDPDLIRLSEQAHDSERRRQELEALVERLVGEEAVATGKCAEAEASLQALGEQSDAIARRASEAFSHPDVDANLVEHQREELDGKIAELADRLQRCQNRADESDRILNGLLPEAWRGLAQYGKDHGLLLDMEPGQWRQANALLHKEIDHLKGTELVQHQAAADEAYTTAVETFRSNVASALYDNFTRLRHQINTLNRTLQRSPAFSNNERYQFKYDVAPEFRDLHRFINKAADVGQTDTLFGSAGEVPAAFRDIIEDKVGSKGANTPSPLDDYRRFFSFEVVIKQEETVIGTLSERMRSGSGGEHRAPLYVIAGAALAAAYGKAEGQQGGLGVIMLDEFGDKIDAQNARATTNYLRSLGLQLIVAAPDTAQGTLSGVLDSYIELFRDGPLLQLERVVVRGRGRELLESDQFQLHPQLLEAEIKRVTLEKEPV
jgi:chromosome segregation protein